MSTYNVENYEQQGGDNWVIGSNGTLDIDGTLDASGSINVDGSLTVTGTQTNRTLNFDTTGYTPDTIGGIGWNDQDRTLDLKVSDDVTQQLGQELFMPRAVNKTGATLSNGTVVYVSGAQGNRPTITKADCDTLATSQKTIGIVTEDIENNAEGSVTTHGLVRGVDTSSWAEGTCLYLSSTAGELTSSEPADGKLRIFVGMVVVQHVTQGVICVRVTRDKYMFGAIDSGNYTYFESDGTLVHAGDSTTFDDLPPVPITAARLGATAPTLATFVGNIQQYTFDNTNDYVIGATEITHKYKEGTDLDIHVHWATNGTDGTDRTVKWQVEYQVANIDTSFTYAYSGSTTVSGEVTIPASTADRSTHILDAGTIDGTNLKIGAYIVWRFERIASSGTEPTADPFALAVGFHMNQDTTGSRQEYTK